MKRIKPDDAGPFEMNGLEYDVITVEKELHILTPDGAIVIDLQVLAALRDV